MIDTLVIYGTPGLSYVEHFKLASVNILHVEREGTGQKETDTTPGNREFLYTATGRINFDASNPFFGPTFGRPDRYSFERIFIMYQL